MASFPTGKESCLPLIIFHCRAWDNSTVFSAGWDGQKNDTQVPAPVLPRGQRKTLEYLRWVPLQGTNVRCGDEKEGARGGETEGDVKLWAQTVGEGGAGDLTELKSRQGFTSNPKLKAQMQQSLAIPFGTELSGPIE